MRLFGYLLACTPFAGTRPGWGWEIVTAVTAMVAPLAFPAITEIQIQDIKAYALYAFGIFVIIRIFLVAPYLAWAKLANDSDHLRAQLSVASAREELMDCIGRLSVMNDKDPNFSDVCRRSYELIPRFSSFELRDKVEEYCGAIVNGAKADDIGKIAYDLTQWIRRHAA